VGASNVVEIKSIVADCLVIPYECLKLHLKKPWNLEFFLQTLRMTYLHENKKIKIKNL
jgi:hypothetical protein